MEVRFMSNKNENPASNSVDSHNTGNEEEQMRALVRTISSYIEHYHGGAVEMVDFRDDVLLVRMTGACEGCELAPVTLHGWVEGTVKQFFPDLNRVVAVED
jgi:Fe-S cluster biogenesis protein NfuA